MQDGIRDMQGPHPMNRLIQGDVGSGKTAVAAALCHTVIQNGFQAALMAPTEILAAQHYESLSNLLAPCGIKTVLITAACAPKQNVKPLRDSRPARFSLPSGHARTHQ